MAKLSAHGRELIRIERQTTLEGGTHHNRRAQESGAGHQVRERDFETGEEVVA